MSRLNYYAPLLLVEKEKIPVIQVAQKFRFRISHPDLVSNRDRSLRFSSGIFHKHRIGTGIEERPVGGKLLEKDGGGRGRR